MSRNSVASVQMKDSKTMALQENKALSIESKRTEVWLDTEVINIYGNGKAIPI